VGLVSVTDVAENDIERPDFAVDRSSPTFDLRGWEDRMNPEDIRPLHVASDDVLVRDIMTPTLYTIAEDTPVPKIAQTMVAGRIHRLIVTRASRMVGIVTSLDLVQLLVGRTRQAAGRRSKAAPVRAGRRAAV
jgi:CBS domain-containing protein